ncbi:glycoside hydrolase family 2 [Spirosoma spitsbergense]|uniref:glycoside hydrolase family 2 n=1 Tax=Spirosoma spitsbergense TaxID=431554 RepID=UPI00037EC510|nr:glycoside hydrolase family 2 [Spirosoma spitsbergense]
MRLIIRFLFALTLLPLSLSAQDELSLAGEWDVAFDTNLDGGAHRWLKNKYPHTMPLPGTTDEAGLGDSLTLKPSLDREALYQLARKHRYIGTAWYRRTVNIPANWKGKQIELMLERVLWQSRVYVDGNESNPQQQESLTTPHRYDLTNLLTPGMHTIQLRINNNRQYEISHNTLAHAYTDGTQTIWNGVIGKLALIANDPVYITHLRTETTNANTVNVQVGMQNKTGRAASGTLKLMVRLNGKDLPITRQTVRVDTGQQQVNMTYDLGQNKQLWDEFSPSLYQLTAKFVADDAQSNSQYQTTFGVRQLTNQNSLLHINGRRLFLRGTLECAIFPLTGHPPTNRAGWEKVFGTARQYGLNHIRFHSWCPPEAAFAVADSLGFYLQIELPLWSLQVGEDPKADQFLRDEAARMSLEYGNHPSFCLWSMGNELEGRIPFLTGLMTHLQKTDKRHLYTTTSYSFQPPYGSWPEPADDYFITQRTKLGWVRGQGVFNQQPPAFTDDYSASLVGMPVPLVTHEVGQYAVFPNMAEIKKYTGVLEPISLISIRNDLQKKGLLPLADDYLKASGKLAAILYKEELERILRTKGASGIQLLDLHDFPGQGTADIGLLDAFWDSKGILTAGEFRQFCSPVVPLLRFPKATYTNAEPFTATAELANFGAIPLTNVTPEWSLTDETGKKLAGGKLPKTTIPVGNGNPLGNIDAKLSGIKTARQLTLTLSVPGTPYHNTWHVWVYPATVPDMATDVVFTQSTDEAMQALAQGKKVLLNPDYKQMTGMEGKFVPVFWSPVHFPAQAITMGLLCDPKHPALRGFPTDFHTDWQWWDLCTKSTTMILPDNKLTPIVRQIDNFANNRYLASIVEAKVGDGRLMLCSFDISSDLSNRPVSRQLKYSLLNYMNTKAFNPTVALSVDEVKALTAKKSEQALKK